MKAISILPSSAGESQVSQEERVSRKGRAANSADGRSGDGSFFIIQVFSVSGAKLMLSPAGHPKKHTFIRLTDTFPGRKRVEGAIIHEPDASLRPARYLT